MTSAAEHPVLQALDSIAVQDLYETAFSSQLGGLLGGRKRQYPPNTFDGECDIVFPSGLGETWIEVKHVYTYHSQKKPHVRNNPRNWLFEKPRCNAIKDVTEKLPRLLNHPDVAHVGFLLVVFASERFPFADDLLGELRLRGKLDSKWREYHKSPWKNVNISEPASSICAYYWERPSGR